jgi:hypothetical protein
MTRGEHLAHSISFALSKAQKVVRGLWLGLTDKERWDVACKTVEHLKEHGDRWRLNEEVESPAARDDFRSTCYSTERPQCRF